MVWFLCLCEMLASGAGVPCPGLWAVPKRIDRQLQSKVLYAASQNNHKLLRKGIQAPGWLPGVAGTSANTSRKLGEALLEVGPALEGLHSQAPDRQASLASIDVS